MPVGRKPKLVPEKAPIEGVLPAPRWLGPEARGEWNRVMPILAERRILTDADLGSLENYCIQIGVARQCEKILQAEGMFVTTRLGEIKRHPANAMQKDATVLARQLASELGLTPVSRSRPAVRDDDGGDSLLD